MFLLSKLLPAPTPASQLAAASEADTPPTRSPKGSVRSTVSHSRNRPLLFEREGRAGQLAALVMVEFVGNISVVDGHGGPLPCGHR